MTEGDVLQVLETKHARDVFVEFDEVMPDPGGVWVIRNKRSGDILGRIEWYRTWRRYVAVFEERAVWSDDCLADIAAFMQSVST